MCVDELDLSFAAGEKFLTRKGDLCNRALAENRGLICQALVALVVNSSKVMNCLDANSPCGLMGMLWRKYISQNINIEINGLFFHSMDVINANLESNELKAVVAREDPCVLLRKNEYDFIYLNCKTSTSHYLDSLFSKVGNKAVIVITTSEDPSLYWQSPGLALRNYGGVIVRTTYFRELGIRLVIAEIARAAARYNKGITVLCSTSYKAQQSFTIILRVTVTPHAATHSLDNIKKLLHCSVCEDRVFVPNSKFALDSPSSLLSCECSKNKDAKVVNEVGPVWSGDIFSAEFVESMLSHSKGYPWNSRTLLLLMQLLEEAKCSDGKTEREPNDNSTEMEEEPFAKKVKTEDVKNGEKDADGQPSFYFNTHRHRPSNHQILKVTNIVRILRARGYRASRTHFDPAAVRTNASLREYLELLEKYQ